MEDKVFCSDILDALTQDFFARKGNPIEEPAHVEEIKVEMKIQKSSSQKNCWGLAKPDDSLLPR